MYKLLIILTIFIVGCQAKDHNSNTNYKKNVHNRSAHAKNNAIYDRYKNAENRYTMLHDGAPGKQNKINFKEPVPVKEPLSRYGNPTEYYVDGHKYKVMNSSSGYKMRGIASWYGKKFHKQRTSSGEPYDMYAMTAAHKTLPLPTYVRVKNLDNARVAVVKVNDRGPFHPNRIIDLSYAAALKLGVFPKGTAHVEIETLMGSSSQAHYYLQAGAFSSQAAAKQLKGKLARITSSRVFVERYQKHYVVRVGPFGSKSMADTLKQKLLRNGINGSFTILV